jgi:hypothetical protein
MNRLVVRSIVTLATTASVLLSAGCSGAPDQTKPEPIAIDQSLVCSAVKGGGGDGCGGGGTGGTPPPPPACSYPGAACCGASVCSGPDLSCIGGVCESFNAVTDLGYPPALDNECTILAADVPVPSELPSNGCTPGITYRLNKNDPTSATFNIWACEPGLVQAGCIARLPLSNQAKLPASRCFGAPLTSQYALYAECTPDMMGGTGPGVVQPRP